MKHSSAELKALARKALIGNYGLCIAASLLFGLFSIIIGFISNWVFPVSGYSSSFMSVASYVFQFLTLLLVQVLNVGFLQISLKISRHEQAQIQDLFSGSHSGSCLNLGSPVFPVCFSAYDTIYTIRNYLSALLPGFPIPAHPPTYFHDCTLLLMYTPDCYVCNFIHWDVGLHSDYTAICDDHVSFGRH